MIKKISKDHKIIYYIIIITLIIVVLVVLVLIYSLFQKNLQPKVEQIPIKETPQKSPLNDVKTNPFKDIKTNPFR